MLNTVASPLDYSLHRCIGEFSSTTDESFLRYKTTLKRISGRCFRQSVFVTGFQPDHPRCDCIPFLPVGNWNDHLQKQEADGIIVQDNGGTRFLKPSTDRWVEIMSQISPLYTKILAI